MVSTFLALETAVYFGRREETLKRREGQKQTTTRYGFCTIRAALTNNHGLN